jgi:uncharacterized protein Yka (UPF0111/DUF47 family)
MHLVVDERCYDLLSDIAKRIPQAAELLGKLIEDPSGRSGRIESIGRLRRDANDGVRELMDRVAARFDTPFDSEDIATLANHLANILRSLDGTARHIRTLPAPAASAHAVNLADVIVAATSRLSEAVRHLREPRRVLEDVTLVAALEAAAETIQQAGLGDLFAPRSQPLQALEILKAKELLDQLEATVWTCRRARLVLQQMALKYA